jgi:hypothetical protein
LAKIQVKTEVKTEKAEAKPTVPSAFVKAKAETKPPTHSGTAAVLWRTSGHAWLQERVAWVFCNPHEVHHGTCIAWQPARRGCKATWMVAYDDGDAEIFTRAHMLLGMRTHKRWRASKPAAAELQRACEPEWRFCSTQGAACALVATSARFCSTCGEPQLPLE